ncbi:MAG: AAA family ATPase [Caryophanon sp.]|nr:AAA family ATPase [Caryophanon sp.]
MQITKLGPIDNGEIKLAPLTIFCGANNQGKTYMSYTIYGILKNLPILTKGFLTEEDLQHFVEHGSISFSKDVFVKKIVETMMNNLRENKAKMLESLFKSESNVFEHVDVNVSSDEIVALLNINQINEHKINVAGTEILLEVLENQCTILMSNNELNEILSMNRMKMFVDTLIMQSVKKNLNTFYIPSERIGINVFRGQLNANKIEMLDIINNAMSINGHVPDTQLLKSLKQMNTSFPEPIDDYLKFINSISNYDIDENKPLAAFVRENIIKGQFVIDANTDKSFFRSQIGKNRYKSHMIPLHITSSSIKSLYGLDYFLENIDHSKLTYLIIDEPEMNLHPANQIQFAKLLNLMVAKNIHVIISTHSDFLVRKIQNIMLQNEIRDEQGLHANNVAVYNFEDGMVNRIDLMDETEAFNNFNDIVVQIEDEYLDLLEERSRKNKAAQGNEERER